MSSFAPPAGSLPYSAAALGSLSLHELGKVFPWPIKGAELNQIITHESVGMELTLTLDGTVSAIHASLNLETEYKVGTAVWVVYEVYAEQLMSKLKGAFAAHEFDPVPPEISKQTIVKLHAKKWTYQTTPTMMVVHHSTTATDSTNDLKMDFAKVQEMLDNGTHELKALDSDQLGLKLAAVKDQLPDDIGNGPKPSGHVRFGIKLPDLEITDHVKIMMSKFPGKCVNCGVRFPQRMPIAWRSKPGARHIGCFLRERATELAHGSPPRADLYLDAADRADAVTSMVYQWKDDCDEGATFNKTCDTDSPEALDHAWLCTCEKAPWAYLAALGEHAPL